jgi:predicted nucleotidyltransferase
VHRNIASGGGAKSALAGRRLSIRINPMRLSTEQAGIIKSIIAREISPDAKIWLFGSRIDDNRRGGDIDLYVETQRPDLMDELRCKIGIEEAIDLHVDLIVARQEDQRPIAQIAKTEGQRL